MGPVTEVGELIHADKYRGKGETFRESCNRVASSLSDNKEHFGAFRDALLHQRFLPGGRIQAAMGSLRKVTPYNCFVSGTIEDSFVAGHGSIMERAKEAASTMRMGGGIGYDFSTLRPRGAMIKKLQSLSSGPIAFMEIFDAVCRCTRSSGHRRGAQMGVMRVDHPDIEAFIHAKQNQSSLTGFNVSVAVTDEFMQAVKARTTFRLRWGGETYQEVDAEALWNMIMRSTWDWAEPGVLFIDTINRMNNLHYCEQISATNPCGEQPLPPYGACLLGSFNLVKYVRDSGFDFAGFMADIPTVVRAMDNVVDRATYPLFEQEQEALLKRRMGLGVTGLANALESMGTPYGSPGFLDGMTAVLTTLRDTAYHASALLAQEKGSFPAFSRDSYMSGEFVKTLSSDVQKRIAEHGIRNSHLLSIAPCGTISLAADNVSSGIECVFAHEAEREYQTFDGPRKLLVQDYGLREWGKRGRTAAEVTTAEHLAVAQTAAQYVDSAVSKTCNVPSTTPWSEFKELYMRAWEGGCKGLTTYQMGGKRAGVLESRDSSPDEEQVAACRIDEETGRRECE